MRDLYISLHHPAPSSTVTNRTNFLSGVPAPLPKLPKLFSTIVLQIYGYVMVRDKIPFREEDMMRLPIWLRLINPGIWKGKIYRLHKWATFRQSIIIYQGDCYKNPCHFSIKFFPMAIVSIAKLSWTVSFNTGEFPENMSRIFMYYPRLHPNDRLWNFYTYEL